MTFHSAKGLDFSSVFIPGLNKAFNIGGLPKLRGTPDYDLKLRRLLFVAVTRARETLYLSYTGTKHPVLSELSSEFAKAYRPK
jgi:DNA helicase-2/ATP-dependent DNA helicase PcrA